MVKIIGAVVPLVNLLTLAGRRRGGNFYRVFQQALRKVFNGIAFERGGEKHRLLAPAGFTGNMLDVLGKAHIQHTVCLVKDEGFNRTAIKVLFFNVLQQSPGGCHHDILVFAEHLGVVHIGHAAGNGRDIEVSMLRQFTGVIGNLHGQLAGWRQDQNTRRA